MADELASTKAEQERLEKEQPVLAQKFRYYQELRGYVTDLVECLDEKVGSYISITTWGDLGGVWTIDSHTHQLSQSWHVKIAVVRTHS